MRRSLLATLICVFAALGAAALAAGPGPIKAEPGPVMAGIARRANDIADAVLSHHIDPPTRQQMILDGLKGVHKAAGVPTPDGLARRVSELAAPDQLAVLLAETWPRPAKKDSQSDELIGTFLGSMLSGIAGAELIPTKELKVAEQIEGNLYVGIHIAISYDETAKRPVIGQVLEGGPAYRAGAHDGDRIEEIDGVSTEGMSLRDAVDRLRGAEGTEVVVRLRDKASGEVRRLAMTRGRMPRPTVSGVRKRSDGGWVFRLDGPDAIGYLRVDDIAGSTPQEFRQIAPRLEAEGIRALILDLRGLSQTGLHPTVLLADSLLDGGTIGRVRTAASVEVYEAEPDSLFRGWPLAVLVDDSTSGAAAWLCAGLQDNHRAVTCRRAARHRRRSPFVGDAPGRRPGGPADHRPSRARRWPTACGAIPADPEDGDRSSRSALARRRATRGPSSRTSPSCCPVGPG